MCFEGRRTKNWEDHRSSSQTKLNSSIHNIIGKLEPCCGHIVCNKYPTSGSLSLVHRGNSLVLFHVHKDAHVYVHMCISV